MIQNQFISRIHAEGRKLKERKLHRRMRTFDVHDETTQCFNGRILLNCASNNPLGLAHHPKVVEAGIEAIRRYGVGATASRLVNGNLPIHDQLEQAIARFKGCEDAIVYPSGYMMNVGVLTAFSGDQTVFLLDKLSHASLIDGAKLSGGKWRSYPHCAMDRLEVLLKRYAQKFTFIVTDSLFSMDGDLAPIENLIRLAKQYNASLLVDEAHATGLLGPSGKGALESWMGGGENDFSMGTLSKAIGGQGGFAAGATSIIRYLRNRSRSFVYSTGLCPAAAGAAIAALDILQENPDLRQKPLENAQYLYHELTNLGYCCHPPKHPFAPAAHILPVIVGENEQAVELSKHLLDQGILAPAIRPPTVPPGTARIRLSVMGAFTSDDCSRIIEAFASFPRRSECYKE